MSELDIIIIADSNNTELEKLSNQSCQALLHVAGKPILEYLLESVANIDHNRVYVVISHASELLERFVGTGERWGLDAEIWLSRGNSTPHEVVRKNTTKITRECFVLDCLSLPNTSLEQVLERLRTTDRNCAQVFTDSGNSNYTWFRQASSSLVEDFERITFNSHKFISVKSFSDYYHANRKLTGEEKSAYLSTRGRTRAIGLTTEAGTRIHSRSLKLGSVFAGANTMAHKSVEFYGTVVLGSEVVIGKGTIVKDAIILDKSYVGENLTVESCIVSGNILIPMDTKLPIELDDPFLLSDLNENATKEYVLTLIDQLIAISLTIISFPLWVITIVLSYVTDCHTPRIRKSLVGNRIDHGHRTHATFDTFEFNCRPRILRHLPLLLAVAQGKIRWCGVMPLPPDLLSERRDSWQLARDQYPVGLFGPAQNAYGLLDEESTSVIDDYSAHLMADAMYAQHKKSELLKEALTKLFKRSIRARTVYLN